MTAKEYENEVIRLTTVMIEAFAKSGMAPLLVRDACLYLACLIESENLANELSTLKNMKVGKSVN